MAVGFFSVAASPNGRVPIPLLPRCGACGLCKVKTCRSPKMPVFGEGRRKILIVGEAPGANEDEQNVPFVKEGDAGALLHATLRKFGVDPDRDCWRTNAVICRPHVVNERGRTANRTPTPLEIKHCQPNLVRAVNELKPHVIIPLGGPAVKSLLSWLWREDVGAISRWDGWRIPCQKVNAWVCPTWHPSYVLRTDYGSGERFRAGAAGNDVRKALFERHLKAACELEGRPWKEVPDWAKEYQVEMNDMEAARTVYYLSRGDRPVAFDYECDRLKPDHPDARIVSCSVSDGKTTMAFPWMGDAREAVRELLLSTTPKIASNQQYEERWTIREFGHGVNGWANDTMVDAHVLDNRPGITSIKFQAFVLLGQAPWDERVRPYLKAKHPNEPNHVRECPLPDLLAYNAMDSLMEWKVAKIQDKLIDQKKVREGSDLFRAGGITLARASANGIRVDEEYLDRMIRRTGRKIKRLQRELADDPVALAWRKEFRERTNYGSNAQLERVIYDVLGYEAKGTTDKGKRRSTSKAALEGIDLPFLRKREKLESLKKARSTGLVGLKRETVDGLVHPFFSLAGGGGEDDERSGPRTYRSGSSDPNIQNQIRRDVELAEIVRRCYVARPGCRLVSVDFAAIEFRIAASFWRDRRMIEYASDPAKDVHRDMAAALFKCPKRYVSKTMRDIAKNQFTFPVLYGSYHKQIAKGIWGLVDKLDAHLGGAGDAAWFADHPVKDYLDSEGIKELGACDPQNDAVPGTFEHHVRRIEERFMERFPTFARRRNEWFDEYRRNVGFPLLTGFWLDGLYSKNQTLDYPVQGPAFHVLLWSMTELRRRITRKGMAALLVAEIHDDILADVPDAETQSYLNLAERVMTRSVRRHWAWIKTPLEVEASCSPISGSWYEKVKWEKVGGVWREKAK